MTGATAADGIEIAVAEIVTGVAGIVTRAAAAIEEAGAPKEAANRPGGEKEDSATSPDEGRATTGLISVGLREQRGEWVAAAAGGWAGGIRTAQARG